MALYIKSYECFWVKYESTVFISAKGLKCTAISTNIDTQVSVLLWYTLLIWGENLQNGFKDGKSAQIWCGRHIKIMLVFYHQSLYSYRLNEMFLDQVQISLVQDSKHYLMDLFQIANIFCGVPWESCLFALIVVLACIITTQTYG